MAKSKTHTRSKKPPAKPASYASNEANQAIPLDELFDEMLVLEAVVYGLCKGLNHHEGELYEDLELAAQVQWSRVKRLLSRILALVKSGDM